MEHYCKPKLGLRSRRETGEGEAKRLKYKQRNKDKFMRPLFPFSHPNLDLVKGDACDVESFIAALRGKDAVISCLGVVASIFNPTTFYSESMFAILEGMKRYI